MRTSPGDALDLVEGLRGMADRMLALTPSLELSEDAVDKLPSQLLPSSSLPRPVIALFTHRPMQDF